MVRCWLFLWEIWGPDIWKLEVESFCFLGHRSNPNFGDWNPENIDFHDLEKLGTLGALICGFEHTKLRSKYIREIPNKLGDISFWKCGFGELRNWNWEMLESCSLGIAGFVIICKFKKSICWHLELWKGCIFEHAGFENVGTYIFWNVGI